MGAAAATGAGRCRRQTTAAYSAGSVAYQLRPSCVSVDALPSGGMTIWNLKVPRKQADPAWCGRRGGSARLAAC